MCEEREVMCLAILHVQRSEHNLKGWSLSSRGPLSLVTVSVRSAGIGPAMDSLLSMPSSHRSTDIQIDVGVLGIQASSLIFLASALPTEAHHQPHKVWSLCKRESTNKEDTERTERGGDTRMCTKDPRQGGKIHL